MKRSLPFYTETGYVRSDIATYVAFSLWKRGIDPNTLREQFHSPEGIIWKIEQQIYKDGLKAGWWKDSRDGEELALGFFYATHFLDLEDREFIESSIQSLSQNLKGYLDRVIENYLN